MLLGRVVLARQDFIVPVPELKHACACGIFNLQFNYKGVLRS